MERPNIDHTADFLSFSIEFSHLLCSYWTRWALWFAWIVYFYPNDNHFFLPSIQFQNILVMFDHQTTIFVLHRIFPSIPRSLLHAFNSIHVTTIMVSFFFYIHINILFKRCNYSNYLLCAIISTYIPTNEIIVFPAV